MRLSQSWKLAVGAAVHEAAAFPFAAGIEPSLVTDAGFVAAEAKVQVAAAEETVQRRGTVGAFAVAAAAATVVSFPSD